jgi:very-short-patch-repair endonuclease
MPMLLRPFGATVPRLRRSGSSAMRQRRRRRTGGASRRPSTPIGASRRSRRAGLPPARANARLGRYEVDLLWPEARLVAEVDGFAFHGSRAAFERDRRRDADLQAQGFRVVRITWRRLTREPEAVAVMLARLLDGSGERGGAAAWR